MEYNLILVIFIYLCLIPDTEAFTNVPFTMYGLFGTLIFFSLKERKTDVFLQIAVINFTCQLYKVTR